MERRICYHGDMGILPFMICDWLIEGEIFFIQRKWEVIRNQPDLWQVFSVRYSVLKGESTVSMPTTSITQSSKESLSGSPASPPVSSLSQGWLLWREVSPKAVYRPINSGHLKCLVEVPVRERARSRERRGVSVPFLNSGSSLIW